LGPCRKRAGASDSGVGTGLPQFSLDQLFFLHTGLILSAAYLSVREHLVLRPASIGRAWIATNTYAAIAGRLNWKLGTNFGFLARTPVNPSILVYLGPWPHYFIVCEGVAPVLFSACSRCARREGCRAPVETA
jgi:uncharacterized membrane protein YwaF